VKSWPVRVRVWTAGPGRRAAGRREGPTGQGDEGRVGNGGVEHGASLGRRGSPGSRSPLSIIDGVRDGARETDLLCPREKVNEFEQSSVSLASTSTSRPRSLVHLISRPLQIVHHAVSKQWLLQLCFCCSRLCIVAFYSGILRHIAGVARSPYNELARLRAIGSKRSPTLP